MEMQNTLSNREDPDEILHYYATSEGKTVGSRSGPTPDLDPNCLQRSSADDKICC